MMCAQNIVLLVLVLEGLAAFGNLQGQLFVVNVHLVVSVLKRHFFELLGELGRRSKGLCVFGLEELGEVSVKDNMGHLLNRV